MQQDNSYRDNTPDSLDLAKTARPVAGSSRKGSNPVLFLVGDSTTRTGTRGNGDNGQWGWGYYAQDWFDADRITVENHALGGLSCRTFYRDWWPDVVKGVEKGDYVIIQIGHNDSGPYDTPFGRSSIPGTGKETVQVTLRDGRVETVLSYGEYLRRYIDEVRAKGATPLLSTLTPRNQWDDGKVRRKNDSYNPWIREVAAEKGVPVIELEEISARDFERWSKDKVNYMFYNDNIHSSAFGAAHNAYCMAQGIAALPQSDLKQYLKPLDLPTLDIAREPGKPALIVTGDSTIKNSDSAPDGMWGWGSVLETVFDASRITLVNAGRAGRSARTFLDEGLWDRVYNSIQPGDYVVIQFGHNDFGPLGRSPFRSELPGNGDETENIFMPNIRKYMVIHTYGWYLRKFIDDVREKGGTPILVSVTPRNIWPDGKIERRDDFYGIWLRSVVKQTGVDYVDMHNISADFFDTIGPDATKAYYKNDHTHTSRLGAERNAKSFAEGLRKAGHPLAKYLK
ncbi:MAG: rhamnogalacturonan acetylesterase [Bacteroidales bacterium]|nr:rhamnogalacturonan acetylesterase [Bacteroidales bacterium]